MQLNLNSIVSPEQEAEDEQEEKEEGVQEQEKEEDDDEVGPVIQSHDLPSSQSLSLTQKNCTSNGVQRWAELLLSKKKRSES